MRSVVLSVLLLVVGATAARADVIIDDFNRPDADTLGPNWTQQAGQDGISGNQAVALGSIPTTLATYNGLSSLNASLDFYSAGAGVTYSAIVLGYADLNNALFVKVQQNGGASYDHLGFYFGNNGDNNGAWSGERFDSLTATFTRGHMTVSLTGTTVTLSLTNLFDGSTPVADQVYTADNVPLALLGTGTGIGIYGSNHVDNFGVVPEPSSIALCGVAGLTLAAFARRRCGRTDG